jgi:lipopolysaccharide transport system permease protein
MSKSGHYTPNLHLKYRFISHWIEILHDLKAYRSLIGRFVYVGLTQQYKKSFLGASWILLSPLISVLLWVLLNASGMFNPGSTPVPYVGFVFISNVIWNFFISFYKGISETYTGRGGELLQNNFPHIVVVAEKMVLAIINFAIPFTLSIIVLVFFDVPFAWTSLLFPMALIPLVLMGSGLGLIFSVIKTVAVDFSTLFDNTIEVLKYITPIVYATTVSNATIKLIIHYNPLTYLIDFPRNILLNQGFHNWELFLVCSVGSLLFFILSLRIFHVSGPVVSEKIII